MQFETERLILRSSDANFAKDVLAFYKNNSDSFEGDGILPQKLLFHFPEPVTAPPHC